MNALELYKTKIITPLEELYHKSVEAYFEAKLFRGKYKILSDDIFKELLTKYETYYNMSQEEYAFNMKIKEEIRK